jgi:hypothetical protein
MSTIVKFPRVKNVSPVQSTRELVDYASHAVVVFYLVFPLAVVVGVFCVIHWSLFSFLLMCGGIAMGALVQEFRVIKYKMYIQKMRTPPRHDVIPREIFPPDPPSAA